MSRIFALFMMLGLVANAASAQELCGVLERYCTGSDSRPVCGPFMIALQNGETVDVVYSQRALMQLDERAVCAEGVYNGSAFEIQALSAE